MPAVESDELGWLGESGAEPIVLERTEQAFDVGLAGQPFWGLCPDVDRQRLMAGQSFERSESELPVVPRPKWQAKMAYETYESSVRRFHKHNCDTSRRGPHRA